MTKFTASTPQAEVIGATILSHLHCIEAEQIAPIVAKYFSEEIDPDKWYPHQTLLNVLHDIEQDAANTTQSLVSIGVEIMEQGTLPPTIETIPDILNSLGVVYHLYHRNVTEPGWTAERLGEFKIRLTHDSPYPNDLAYGIAWSSVRRFVPDGWQFSVTTSDPKQPDDPVFYDVEWEPI